MDKIEISTKCGNIEGLSFDDYNEFRGIKYATAKRWEYPQKTGKWEGTYDATEFGECSYQRRAFEDDKTANAFYHKEFRKGMSFKYSDDCLFLNITAPKNSENCPVLIYIHGGSFTGGSANEAHISGIEFARKGIVFVSFNYRLGPFGFCSHPGLTDENGVCGNYGLYDQQTAITWVKDNIEAFGGDSNCITLMGQSAGAMSVDIHISNPLMKDYFSGAIMMSGAAMQRGMAKPVTPERTADFWQTIIDNAKVKSIEELRNVDDKTLYYAWYDACQSNKKSMVYTLPVIDGKLITKASFNMDTIPNMPKIIGITSADMVPEVLKILVKKWVSHDKGNCYVYLFARDLPGDNCGAWHSSDLLYAFSTLKNNWRPFEKVDFDISNQMSNSFAAFAKSGNPNCPEIPTWNTGCKKVMTFCENTKAAKWQTAKLIKNTLFNRGPV